MDRTTLQQLADLRVKDAEALLATGQWQAAYYLLGYSIECALKARVAKRFREHDVPDRKLVNSFYTHNLDELLTLSDLKSAMQIQFGTNAKFEENWDTVQRWNETARYDIGVTEASARRMHYAVTNTVSGICHG